jgi:hypothetical protein
MSDNYKAERENDLVDMDLIIERFAIVEDNSPLPILKVTLDGKEISIADLVHAANQLASALNDRGCWFEVK